MDKEQDASASASGSNVREEGQFKTLRPSEDIFSLLVSSVKDYAIFMLDPNGNVLTWNKGAERAKGYAASDIIGKNFSTFFTEEAKAINHPQKELEIAKKDGRYEEEGWRVRKDKSQFWASVVITPVYADDGTHLGFAKVTRDLTERRKAELQLEQARDEAVMANRLKSQFVANVTHEIRTPLSGIVGLSQLLTMEESLTDDQREMAVRVFESSKRLLVILNDLLDFAKLEAGRVDVENVPYSIRDVIDDVMGLSAPTAKEKNIELNVQLTSDCPNDVNGDPGKVRQILLNLVNNAVKFTEKGGVELSVEQKDGELLFSVTDTGLGIDSESQTQLFQPFVQVDGTNKRRFGGTGLGLSIAQQYVELMGGHIGVHSEPSRGSTFWFSLPLSIPSRQSHG